jgi:hypothetical protein
MPDMLAIAGSLAVTNVRKGIDLGICIFVEVSQIFRPSSWRAEMW